MTDRNLREFETRLHRIEQIHQAGGAFEASGSLGRAYFDSMRAKQRRSFPLRASAMILCGALLLKAGVLAQIGVEAYEDKVATLAEGGPVQMATAWVLKTDPITRDIAGAIRRMIF